jgi:hypothetical protein
VLAYYKLCTGNSDPRNASRPALCSLDGFFFATVSPDQAHPWWRHSDKEKKQYEDLRWQS